MTIQCSYNNIQSKTGGNGPFGAAGHLMQMTDIQCIILEASQYQTNGLRRLDSSFSILTTASLQRHKQGRSRVPEQYARFCGRSAGQTNSQPPTRSAWLLSHSCLQFLLLWPTDSILLYQDQIHSGCCYGTPISAYSTVPICYECSLSVVLFSRKYPRISDSTCRFHILIATIREY